MFRLPHLRLRNPAPRRRSRRAEERHAERDPELVALVVARQERTDRVLLILHVPGERQAWFPLAVGQLRRVLGRITTRIEGAKVGPLRQLLIELVAGMTDDGLVERAA